MKPHIPTTRREAFDEAHDRWLVVRDLDYAERLLGQVCTTVRPTIAPRSAAYVRRARKSLQGAIRHAKRLHFEAQAHAERLS